MSIQTALSIVQRFKKGINQPAPIALVSVTDPDELQVIEHLNEVVEYIRDNGPFRSHLRDHDFTTTSGTTTYNLPGDFWQAAPITQYNEDNNYPMLGPLSDADFAVYRERGWSTPNDYIWRVAGFAATLTSTDARSFEIYPAPASNGENLGFDYFSGNLYLPTGWFASQDQDAHYSIAADTDYCAFDSNIVKLGLEWKYRQDTSKDQVAIKQAKDDFDDAIKASRFRHHGSRRGVFGTKRRHAWYPVPEGNWSF